MLFSVIVVIMACQNTTKHSEKEQTAESKSHALSLLQNNCLSCHNPAANQNNNIAPSLTSIREQYITKYKERELFQQNILAFVNNPSPENAIMPDAVRQYGIMPKLEYNQNDLKAIADYLFDNDLSTDEWRKEWEGLKSQVKTSNTDTSYLEIGRYIANNTKTELGKNLLQAIKKYGTTGALEFCNTKAIPITDSMSVVQNAKIARVSDKPRNPNNKANESEMEIINDFKNRLKNKQALEPKLLEGQDIVTGYYPILTNTMCLQCHGQKEKEILPETLTKIKKLYPNDLAYGYGENELRGLFKVVMTKNTKIIKQ